MQSRITVARFGSGPLDVRPGSPQAVEGDAIGGGIKGWRHEGFDAMGNRIHAGGCGQHRRQAEGQFRVADGHARHDIR